MDAATAQVGSIAPSRPWRPVDVAVVVLATAATLAVLHFARPFLIPLAIGILAAYALRPVVAALERIRFPRTAGAAIVLVALTALAGAGGYSLRGDANAAIRALPEAARKIRNAMHESTGAKPGPIAHVNRAAKELERAAAEATGRPAAPVPPANEPSLAREARRYLLDWTSGALAVAGQLGIAALLAFLLLAAGDAFRRNLMHLVEPSLARKRLSIGVLDEIDDQIQRYVLVSVATNLAIAVAVAAYGAAAGLQNALLWGAAAGVAHFVPFAGVAAAAAGIALAAFLQSGTLAFAVALALGTIAIATSLSFVFQTWLQARTSRMNAVAIFVGLMFWGWLWGAWGLVLAVPLVAATKAIADRAAPPLGALLGR
jgi:predicted PurR-regulated permease PerM